jgi:hypothetical protein
VDNQQYLWAASCSASCVTNKGSWQAGQWQFYQITNQVSVGNRIVDWPTAAHFIDSNGIGRTYEFAESTDSAGNSYGTIDAFFSEDDYQSGYAYEWWDLGSPDFNYVMAPVALTQDLADGVLQEYPLLRVQHSTSLPSVPLPRASLTIWVAATLSSPTATAAATGPMMVCRLNWAQMDKSSAPRRRQLYRPG